MNDRETPSDLGHIETPRWTLSGWLWGIVGVYVAMFYLAWWYFLFATPLLLIFSALMVFTNLFVENQSDAIGIASLIFFHYVVLQHCVLLLNESNYQVI